jgi:hypothetical protein
LLAEKEVLGSKYGGGAVMDCRKRIQWVRLLIKDREDGGKEREEARDLAH